MERVGPVSRRRAILLYHVVHFSALVPLLAEAGERALITVFVRILQAVNVNAAASAAEKCSYETMVVLRVRGPGVVLRCIALCCIVLCCIVVCCIASCCVVSGCASRFSFSRALFARPTPISNLPAGPHRRAA